MRPIDEIDCGLWRTPNQRDGKGAYTDPEAFRRRIENGHQLNLNDEVRMTVALWQTPVADDAPDRVRGKINSRGEPKLSGQVKALWSTPRASDGEKGGPNQSFGAGGQPLPAQAFHVAMWPTPTSRDHKDGAFCPNVPTNGLLGRTVWNGSQDTTEKPGALNPAFAFWLMGFPPEWESCAPLAMPSSRRLRQKS